MARPKKSASSSKTKRGSRKTGFGGDGESLPKAKPKEVVVALEKAEVVAESSSGDGLPLFSMAEGSEAHQFTKKLFAELSSHGIPASETLEAVFHIVHMQARRLPRDTIVHQLLRAVPRIKEGLPL